jgi:hypothetical protein
VKNDNRQNRIRLNTYPILNPLFAIASISIPMTLVTLLVDPEIFWSQWRQPYYLTLEVKLVAVVSLFSLTAGTFLGLRRSRYLQQVQYSIVNSSRLRASTDLLFRTYCGAYLIWIAIAVSKGFNPSLLLQIASGSDGAIYQIKQFYFDNIPAVTSWIQLGALIGPLLIIGHFVNGDSIKRRMLIILTLTVLRAFLLSERLALIELLISLAICYLALSKYRPKLKSQGRTAFLYVFALTTLYLFFAVTEYFRSWLTYYSSLQGDFWSFTFLRQVGYYATALNNGGLLWTSGAPIDRFSSVIHFPTLGDALRAKGYFSGTINANLLAQNSNPEFNNVSTYLSIPALFGPIAGVLIFFIIGFLVGRGYRLGFSGNLWQLIGYAVAAVGLFESMRFFYYGDSRFLPILFGWFVVRPCFTSLENNFEGEDAIKEQPRYV